MGMTALVNVVRDKALLRGCAGDVAGGQLTTGVPRGHRIILHQRGHLQNPGHFRNRSSRTSPGRLRNVDGTRSRRDKASGTQPALVARGPSPADADVGGLSRSAGEAMRPLLRPRTTSPALTPGSPAAAVAPHQPRCARVRGCPQLPTGPEWGPTWPRQRPGGSPRLPTWPF